jgi:acetyltransferase-like isoleucine patch superfamily enzyme
LEIAKKMHYVIRKVVIGNNCWIGAKILILKDIVLADNCVVASISVGTRLSCRKCFGLSFGETN